MTGNLHEHLHKFMKISRRILPKIRIFSDNRCTENHKTHFVFR